MKENLEIAIIQTDIFWQNKEKNINYFSKKINDIDKNIDIVILPEMFSTGFTNNTDLAENMQGTTVKWLQSIAKTRKTTIIGSIIIEENNKFHNRLLVVNPQGDLFYYDKRHLFISANENKFYTKGSKKLLVDIDGWKICPLICYDLRFPVWSRNYDDYDLLIYIASWPSKRKEIWSKLLYARAIENLSYTIGLNRVGIDGNNYKYSGNSLAINYKGDKIVELPDNKEETTIITLNYNKQKEFRTMFPALLDID